MTHEKNVNVTNKKAYNEAKRMFLTRQYQQKEIAEMVGVSEQTVCRWAKEYRREIDESLEHLLEIAEKTENAKDKNFLLNLYKKLGGL